MTQSTQPPMPSRAVKHRLRPRCVFVIPKACALRLVGRKRMLSAELPLTIRFEDADPAGVVFYPRALALAHGAVEELIRQSALGWDAWFASDTHAAPLRRAEADFFLPMKPGQKMTLRAAVEKTGTTSVAFAVDFHDQAGHLAARIRTVHVLIDKATGHPVPLTPKLRKAFAA